MNGFERHPYIPNSVPEVQQEMLQELGMSSLRRRQGALLQAVRQRKKTPVPCRYRRFFAEKQAYCS